MGLERAENMLRGYGGDACFQRVARGQVLCRNSQVNRTTQDFEETSNVASKVGNSLGQEDERRVREKLLDVVRLGRRRLVLAV